MRLATVIHDVDETLRSLVAACVPANGGGVLVSFSPPTPEWAAAQSDPVIDLFLYDVREDLEWRSGDEIDVRDADGRVIGRQPSPRRYQLSYLASAWAKDPEEEHQMLAAILAHVPDAEGISAEHLKGSLPDAGLPVLVKVGIPVTGANTWDLWSALGTPPRTAVEIVVTAPLIPALRTDLGPPAETLELDLFREPPGKVGAARPEPAGPEPEPEPKEPSGTKGRRRRAGEGSKESGASAEGGPPVLPSARPGKRWATFKVREHVVETDEG
ncbi:MAG: DUF4255 domain-containing protein [Acidimicrobiales bacterium]